MSGMTAYLERLFLRAILLGIVPKLPEKVYLGLFTTIPTRDGEGVEVQGIGYKRVPVTFDEMPLLGIYRNLADVWFPDAESDWGRLSHFALFDAPLAGNMLIFGPLVERINATAGSAIRFDPGALSVVFSKKVEDGK